MKRKNDLHFFKAHRITAFAVLLLFTGCVERPNYRIAVQTGEGGPVSIQELDIGKKSPWGGDPKNSSPFRELVDSTLGKNESIAIWPSPACVVSFSCQEPEGVATLKDVIWYGASINPQVSASVAREKVALAELNAAIFSFGPTPSIALDSDYITTSVSQPIFAGGQLRYALKGARKRAEIASAEVRIVQLNTSLAIVDAYGSWLVAYLAEDIWQDAFAAKNLVVKRIERRVEAGLSEETELIQSRYQLIAVRREIFAITVARERALKDLQLAIGSTILEKALIASATIDVPKTAPTQEAINAVLETSPFIAKASAEVQNAEIGLALARARIWPTLSIVGQIKDPNVRGKSNQSVTRQGFLQARSDFGAAFSFKARITAAKASLEAAQESLGATRRTLIGSIEQDYVLLNASLVNKKVALELVDATKSLLESNQRKFASGTKGWQDLMSSIQELASTKVLEIDAGVAAFSSAWRIILIADTPYAL